MNDDGLAVLFQGLGPQRQNSARPQPSPRVSGAPGKVTGLRLENSGQAFNWDVPAEGTAPINAWDIFYSPDPSYRYSGTVQNRGSSLSTRTNRVEPPFPDKPPYFHGETFDAGVPFRAYVRAVASDGKLGPWSDPLLIWRNP
jgi:hypothetical protein